jgi:valyl-tRNA synthetase
LIPHVTEEIWHRLPKETGVPFLMLASFPEPEARKVDDEALKEMSRLMSLVTGIRTIRATYEVDPRRQIDVTIVAPREDDRRLFEAHAPLVRALGVIKEWHVVSSAADAPRTIKQPVDTFELRIPMSGLFDLAAEKTRLTKERLKLEAEIETLAKRLENPQFVERARPEVVAEARTRRGDVEERLAKVAATLMELGG